MQSEKAILSCFSSKRRLIEVLLIKYVVAPPGNNVYLIALKYLQMNYDYRRNVNTNKAYLLLYVAAIASLKRNVGYSCSAKVIA